MRRKDSYKVSFLQRKIKAKNYSRRRFTSFKPNSLYALRIIYYLCGMLKAKTVNESVTIMTEHIMPNDTNPLGNLMGGNLMRWMDIAAAVCAGKHCGCYVVTASVDYVSFQGPIHLGDVITITACVTRAFNTSVEIFVEVVSADIKGGNMRKCNDAYLTFVALDDVTRKPTAMPPVLPLNESEKQRYEAAARRREIRLVQSGKIKLEDAELLKAIFKA